MRRVNRRAFATGFLKLELADPAPKKLPLITVKPAPDGQVVVELSLSK